MEDIQMNEEKNIVYATEEDIKKYKQVRIPDYALLSDLVIKAKGPNKSMGEFALETNISQSSLSRIINSNIKRPLSINNIIKIYNAREDRGDFILLDKLARANGLLPEEDIQIVENSCSRMSQRTEILKLERLIKNTLIAYVVTTAEYRINNVFENKKALWNSSFLPSTLGDLGFSIETINRGDSLFLEGWIFNIFAEPAHRSDENNFSPISYEKIIERSLKWFILNSWEPDELKQCKVSFVFTNERNFTQFVNDTKNAKVNEKIENMMTAILLDTVTFQIEREVSISVPSFFSK